MIAYEFPKKKRPATLMIRSASPLRRSARTHLKPAVPPTFRPAFNTQPRKKQPEGDLIGQCGAQNAAGEQTETYHGGGGSNEPQVIPAGTKAVMPRALDAPLVESQNCGVEKLGARLCEGLFRDLVYQLRLLVQMRKELVQLGLDTHAHTAEQRSDQGWRGQLALPRESSREDRDGIGSRR